MTSILLIRHATTEMVGKHIAGRMAGVHLNDVGRSQAMHLAERLKRFRIDAIYSSPLERAVETAEPIAQSHQLEIAIYEELIELDFGEWTGAEIKNLESDPVFQLFNMFRSATQVPGGEWMNAAQARMVIFLQGLCARHPGQTVVVVSHSDMIKAAVAYYAGIHLDQFQRIEIDPASVSIIDIFPETVRIKLLNSTGNL